MHYLKQTPYSGDKYSLPLQGGFWLALTVPAANATGLIDYQIFKVCTLSSII